MSKGPRKTYEGITPVQRFWRNVEKTQTCWLWRGHRAPSGYGILSVHQVKHRAHRFAYELLRGPIPIGLVLDHACRVRHCVNPDHLEPVTEAENAYRGISFSAINRRKTSCVHGHEFTEENTYRSPRGYRACRRCRKIQQLRRQTVPDSAREEAS